MTTDDSGAIDWRMRPRRAAGVELSEVTDGFLVYEPARDRVHYLNATAALLLEVCDGTMRAAELPGFLAAAFTLPEPPATRWPPAWASCWPRGSSNRGTMW